MTRTLRRLAALVLLFAPLLASAQEPPQIDVIGGQAAALPIAVVPFAGSAGETDIAKVIAADLDRSGQFRTLPEGDMVERPTSAAQVSYPTWRTLRQDFLLIGRVIPDGAQLRVEYELFDVAKQTRILGEAKIAPGAAARDVAHQIADAVYEKVLGVRGAFWTRIAYVTASGTGNNRHFELMVADSDGFNAQSVVSSPQPILSPSWSPDGKRLAYVSFDRGNSSIYIQNLASSGRELIASFRGINGAPAFSPDGTRLAMTLSRSGNPEVYVMDLGSKQLHQITNQMGIDTEPVWSADGATIYFTSDRGGRPQIYQAPASGGGATRLTFQGSYNARATVSYDGKKIATAQGNGNAYRIALMDRALGNRWTTLSPGNLDESPSFAPNASMLLYAAKEGGRSVLYTVSADGRARLRLPVAGANVQEPAWGPYRQKR
ncbi:Tol-Pal system beta propeller repeat protein TolB [Lysobacter sp. KIS68-7]|uniref:Tol-Pal system beta propeller repeat protein TolB n=1 Tax=Lysobacter sp. KIS68-7 TaxID=2904252 RepID=UPI001E45F0A8|nr:Tol-Pal system beta propeller repeat protein TolB [Lysobacter sp. KIS68-7]UHQ19883.1 Tol-Pal system beta propeller repeat protein TolB [Lysobacter sp. KIS68-7]